VKVDGFNSLYLIHNLHWISADEKVLVSLEAIHGVTRTVTGYTGISFYCHQSCGEFFSRVWIPSCVKGRVKRQSHAS
jgi:hypothetical protein